MYSLNTVGKIIKFSKKSQNLSEKTEVENFKDVSILSTSWGGAVIPLDLAYRTPNVYTRTLSYSLDSLVSISLCYKQDLSINWNKSIYL